VVNCDYCGKPIENPKGDQRFCSWKTDTHCRQKWHHEHQLPGVVKVVRKLKGHKWTVTIHYSEQPAVGINQRVARLETEPNSRTEASRDTNEEAEP
jgi:hypothetical protein